MHKRNWIALALAAASSVAMAQATPQGLWRTIDDETGKEKSLVRIVDNGGVFGGRIEKLLDPAKQDSKCDKCSDARKGQPVLGMTILENVRKNADEAYWDGGTILDPNNGKSYRVRLTPKDGGKTLEVRGFIGPFYRNQTWQRVE
ncbi:MULTISPECIES: DUF2147 domain-containing protein [unclassified Rubrivivax]|uniref:DUF2147 domain-containing protein n=1 Tax=unclassified Rubrivivax TaxID=2649762 RepID=UPI001E57EB2D|nr:MULTISPECIES: DUF2147 domain-containing protein [unclassified Rubrivivax]MCC9598679.1 DUF2147 domain-containing protein [Rubrivivax sp. JA1055]MCC9648379.1 DUF2147 domain-containing protein [Rubrivivax sp. JA1029]MCD0418691.1 DUF2147 domain-containing protein [Rubrivivax sp. JA1024]